MQDKFEKERSDTSIAKSDDDSISFAQHIKNLEVLVVEDNRIIQRVVQKQLLDLGVQPQNITLVENGSEAVGCVRKREKAFDVIYMDDEMPFVSGREATLLIRKIEKKQNLGSSIILTCSATFEAIFPGANVRLTKPLQKNELQSFVSTVIEHPERFPQTAIIPASPSKPSYKNHSGAFFSSSVPTQDARGGGTPNDQNEGTPNDEMTPL